MNIISILRFIINHPLNKGNKMKAISRFVKWQFSTMLSPYPIIYQFTDKSKLIIKKGMAGATGNLYCGLHEYQEMLFLLHFLKESDLFVDIGANIGSYTILASAHINAYTIAIEPEPFTFAHLLNNVFINNIQRKVRALNIALGSYIGEINFSNTHDTTNHVSTDVDKDVISVMINTLDNILNEEKMPILLKIDLEGFETEVLKGACKTLENKDLKVIIIELNGSGKRYGYDETLIHQKLVELDFKPYIYNPMNRTIIKINNFNSLSSNTIYIRDTVYVESRLKNSDEVKILGKKI